MKHRTSIFAIGGLAFALATLSFHTLDAARRNDLSTTRGAQTANPSSGPRMPVLVELFTSEGCSSCPPADALLAKLDNVQPVPGAEVIVLEQHVTYWDDQGWRDPFALLAATGRQEDYSKTLHSEVYTPQMVVDGHIEFVGSEEGAARRAITASESSPKATIKLSWGDSTGDTRTLHIRAEKLPATESASTENADVILALTESHLHSDVSRGENAGRGLEHDGVVRQFTRIGRAVPNSDVSFEAQSTVKLAKSWKRENLRAVVFIQGARTRRVLAAAVIPF